MIDEKAEALAWWARRTVTQLDSPEFEVAAHVLSYIDGAMQTHQQIAEVGVELFDNPPPVIGRLTAGQALSLAKKAARAELGPAENIRRKITAVQRFDDDENWISWDVLNQQAALAAIRQLGGARKLAIPEWMEAAIGDIEHWTACEHVMNHVALACETTAPGRRWSEVYHLGVITYELA